MKGAQGALNSLPVSGAVGSWATSLDHLPLTLALVDFCTGSQELAKKEHLHLKKEFQEESILTPNTE